MKITATSDTKPQTATSGLQWDEIRYVYDALGRRLAKIVTENGNFKRATRFIYDGWNVVEERTERQGAGGISKFLFWGEDLSGSQQGAGGVGGLVAHMEKPDSASWTAYYYHSDANGNIAAVTSPFRALAAKFSYDAFGRTTSQSGPKSGIDIHALNYRFSTKPMELELATSNSTLVPPPASSGLYYYGYRFYSPNLGRWISRDPIREKGGRNLYNFVGNDGVDKWDLLGLECKCGPDITEWFIDELHKVKNKIAKLKINNLHDALKWMERVGGSMDSLPSGDTEGCATGPECKETVFIFGKCLGYRDLSNVLFGFVSREIQLPPSIRNLGADLNNRSKGQGPENFNQTVEYSIGSNLSYSFKKKPDFAEKDIQSFMDRQNQIIGIELIGPFFGDSKFKKCKPCGKKYIETGREKPFSKQNLD